MSCNVRDSLLITEFPPTNLGMFKLGLALFGKLCEILQQYDPMASCDISTAIARAGCCPDVGPFGMLKAIYGKLCDLEEAVETGGGGATCITCEDRDPVDITDVPPCDCSLWLNFVDRRAWGSNNGVSWVPFIY